MKKICFLSLLLPFFACTYAQTMKKSNAIPGKGAPKCISYAKAIRLSYPDTLQPLLLNTPLDIKAQGGTFVMQVYDPKGAVTDTMTPAALHALDSIPDACYRYVREYKGKKKVGFREYTCSDGAAGHTYYTYLYKLHKKNNTIILKFTNAHCNACTDAHDQPIPYDEKKETCWIQLILDSVKLL
jgi:hypothetical protein